MFNKDDIVSLIQDYHWNYFTFHSGAIGVVKETFNHDGFNYVIVEFRFNSNMSIKFRVREDNLKLELKHHD